MQHYFAGRPLISFRLPTHLALDKADNQELNNSAVPERSYQQQYWLSIPSVEGKHSGESRASHQYKKLPSQDHLKQGCCCCCCRRLSGVSIIHHRVKWLRETNAEALSWNSSSTAWINAAARTRELLTRWKTQGRGNFLWETPAGVSFYRVLASSLPRGWATNSTKRNSKPRERSWLVLQFPNTWGGGGGGVGKAKAMYTPPNLPSLLQVSAR